MDGFYTKWYENGKKSERGTYRHGIKVGKWIQWYENGQKKVEYPYKDGKSDGIWTSLYENGQKQYDVTFKSGEKISQNCWDEDGNKCECSENWWEGCK